MTGLTRDDRDDGDVWGMTKMTRNDWDEKR